MSATRKTGPPRRQPPTAEAVGGHLIRSHPAANPPCRARPPEALGSLDLDVHAGRERQLVEGVDRLAGRLDDVDHPLVGPDLELLARLLVDVRTPQHRV